MCFCFVVYSTLGALTACPCSHPHPATAAAADMQPDEEAEEGAELRQHRRGMSPYVFVPFEQVANHVINLPVSEMDVFLPG